MMPTRYNVGDKVVVTEQNVTNMHNSNRSCVTPGYPNKAFLDKLEAGMRGEVTHTFPPGYEVTVTMDNGNAFHMKDNWITKA